MSTAGQKYIADALKVRKSISSPCPKHHVQKNREEIVHGPQEVILQLSQHLLGDLLKGLLDDIQLVSWSESGAGDEGKKDKIIFQHKASHFAMAESNTASMWKKLVQMTSLVSQQ